MDFIEDYDLKSKRSKFVRKPVCILAQRMSAEYTFVHAQTLAQTKPMQTNKRNYTPLSSTLDANCWDKVYTRRA